MPERLQVHHGWKEARRLGRVSTIVSYFMDYTRRRSQILKRAVQSSAVHPEKRDKVGRTHLEVPMPAYFAEYISRGLDCLLEDIDIIRGGLP